MRGKATTAKRSKKPSKAGIKTHGRQANGDKQLSRANGKTKTNGATKMSAAKTKPGARKPKPMKPSDYRMPIETEPLVDVENHRSAFDPVAEPSPAP